MALRILTAADVRQALPMQDCIEGMKQAYAQLSAGNVEMPLRSRVQGAENSSLLVMPAYAPQAKSLAVKLVSVFPQNTQHGLPLIHATVMIMNADTGKPLALLEGGALTAIRTGAGAGAATDILARKNARVVAVLGSGVQARTQLEAVCAVRKIERVYVYSPNRSNAEKFAVDMAGTGMIPDFVLATDTAAEAVQKADIICTATISFTPVFNADDLQEGAHINAVGSYLPDMQEVDTATIQRSLVTVDSRSAVWEEAGDLIVPLNQGEIDKDTVIHAELGEIINGEQIGRTDPNQITYFKSVGVAVQDAIAAKIALENAQQQQLGTVIHLT